MDLIRVKDNTTGHHYTIPEHLFDKDLHTKVTSKTDPAVDHLARPAKPKFAVLRAVKQTVTEPEGAA